ncbi:MAG: hypothetical protein ACYCOU_15035, partial [Sulfobacillus sp.]
ELVAEQEQQQGNELGKPGLEVRPLDVAHPYIEVGKRYILRFAGNQFHAGAVTAVHCDYQGKPIAVVLDDGTVLTWHALETFRPQP